MNVEIIKTPLLLNIYGCSGSAANKNYVETAFSLMGKMWELINTNKLKHKGLNIWVYEPYEKVFAGVEPEGSQQQLEVLEHKFIELPMYGYFKHIGPYNQIKNTGQAMKNELKRQGYETALPYVEIYGHWTSDESKLETELLMSLVQC